MAKLEALPGRFALIHHCVRSAGTLADTDLIGVESIEAGIRLAEWCAYEADRVYQMFGESEGERSIRKLMEHVSRLADRAGGRLTVKLLQKSNSRKYRRSQEAKADLERLVGQGLGRWEEGPAPPNGGRRPLFYIPTIPIEQEADEAVDTASTTSDDSDHRSPVDPILNADVHDDRPLELQQPAHASDENPDVIPFPSLTSTSRPQASKERWSESSKVVQRHRREAPSGRRDEDLPSIIVHPAARCPKVPFTLITNQEGLATVHESIMKSCAPIGLDLETTGLRHDQDRIRLLSLATDRGAFLIDVFQIDPKPLWPALASVEIIGHNLAFDLPFLLRMGFEPGRVADTMLASQVLHAGDAK